MSQFQMPWLSPPPGLELASDEVHVWRAPLDGDEPDEHELLSILAADEVSRAERFVFPRDRRRYIAARGALRRLLSRYLAVEPARIRFCYSAYGKPSLDAAPGQQALHFNVSHSHGLALYAVASRREVGIDLERLRSDLPCRQMAEHCFSGREIATLSTLPAEQVQEAFFHCWTRKEAYIKARGEGLSLSLDGFAVSLLPGEPAALLEVRGSEQEAFGWALQGLFPGEGYVGAVAAQGHGWRVVCLQWPGAQ